MLEDILKRLREAWDLLESEDWDRMLKVAEESRVQSEKAGFSIGTARALALEAFVHYIRADFKTALSECIEALHLGAGDAESESRIRGVLALVHWSLGNYEEALKNSDSSLTLLGKGGADVPRAFAYAVKGGILLSLGQLDEALDWHQRSLEAFKATPDYVVGKARALSGLGLTYLAQKRFPEALAALLEALELARRAHHRISTARALNDVGQAFEALEDDQQAIQYHVEALEIRQQEGFRQAETTSLLALGRIYSRLGENSRAIELLNRSLEIAKDLGLKPRIAECHHALADVYQSTSQLAPALHHVLSWEKARSELAVEEAALRYRALALETQLEAVQRNTELEGLASLGGLVAAIAHEINSPLGAIRSSANVAILAAEKLVEGHDPKAVKALQQNAKVITQATSRISDLVSRLKIFAGIDQARYAKVNILRAIEDSIALLRPEFEDRIKVFVEHETVPELYVYPTELHQAFLNLLRNALQAIDGAGVITVRITLTEMYVRVGFTDSGRGIPAEALPNLFTPSFSAGSGRVRASLSLFTCLAIAKKHGGDIKVESQVGQGSTFMVMLPRSLERTDAELEAAVS